MSTAREELERLVFEWDVETDDVRDQAGYRFLLDEILFHADLRYHDYVQYRDEEGDFPFRLKNWLGNLAHDRQRKVMLKLLSRLVFVDHLQMQSLYRDAYRRIIVPWLRSEHLSADDLLSADYDQKLLSLLLSYHLMYLTESFSFLEFVHVNNLTVPKATLIGDEVSKVKDRLPEFEPETRGVIVFEDLVGTGKQSGDVIAELRLHIPPGLQVLFIPLIILELGLRNLREWLTPTDVQVEPVLVVPDSTCIREQPIENEPAEVQGIRTLILQTAERVMAPNGDHDDPPDSPFGYRGCGALVVTCHNAPNNTLSLIHHRAPNWHPLFRRVHHPRSD